jgi:hypothetical protein
MKSLLLAVLLSAGLLAPHADLSGDWRITGDVQGYPIDEACTLAHKDATLSGTCAAQGKNFPTTGTVDGNKVVFKHGGEYQGDPLTLTFTGVVADDGTFSGTIYVDPMAVDGTFAAKKQVAKPAAGM